MRREDITDELLIAFADGELSEPQASEVNGLVAKHEELQEFVNKQKELSSKLKDYFNTSEIETPAHIAEEIRELAAKTKKSDNVIKLSTFQKFKNRTNLTMSSIKQIAAALAIGVYIGPSLFDQTGSVSVENSSELNQDFISLRGNQNKIVTNLSMSNNSTNNSKAFTEKVKIKKNLMTVTLSESDFEIFVIQNDERIASGDNINASRPFRLSVKVPFDGSLSLMSGGLNEEVVEIIPQIDVKSNQEIWLPEQGKFKILEQSKFSVRIVLTGTEKELEASLEISNDVEQN